MKKYIILVFVFCMFFSVSAFAAIEFDPAMIDKFPADGGKYVLFRTHDGYVLMREVLGDVVVEPYDDGTFKIEFVGYSIYNWQDGKWVEGNSYPNTLTPYYCDQFYFSNFDVKTADGTVFFSPKLTIQDLPRIVQKKALIVAGVGILVTSLMLLPHLLRKLLVYL